MIQAKSLVTKALKLLGIALVVLLAGFILFEVSTIALKITIVAFAIFGLLTVCYLIWQLRKDVKNRFRRGKLK